MDKLLVDALKNIVGRLTHRDVIRMTSVSKSWKELFPITREPPWLMMLTNSNVESPEGEEIARQFFSLSDNTIYSIEIPQIRHKHCCGCFMNAGGWLMTVDQDTVIRLVYPWGSRRIEERLPPSDVLRKHVHEADMNLFSSFDRTLVMKAAMSDDGVFLVVINASGSAFFLIRGGDVWTKFSELRNNEGNTTMRNSLLHDVIYHMGVFYAVNLIGNVGVLRTDDAKLQPLETKATGTHQDLIIRHYLVGDSTSGCLYLVERIGRKDETYQFYGRETTGFKVYEIKKDAERIKETLMVVQSLHDGVIFLGLNSSLLVKASQFTGNIRRNCVYFTDDTPLRYAYFGRRDKIRADMGIFNIEDNRIDRLLVGRSHPRFSMPLWITPPPVRRPPLGASGASSSGKS